MVATRSGRGTVGDVAPEPATAIKLKPSSIKSVASKEKKEAAEEEVQGGHEEDDAAPFTAKKEAIVKTPRNPTAKAARGAAMTPASQARPRSTERNRSMDRTCSIERPRSMERPRSTDGPSKEPLPDDFQPATLPSSFHVLRTPGSSKPSAGGAQHQRGNMLCRLAAIYLIFTCISGMLVGGLLLMLRQEWGTPVGKNLQSFGGLLQSLPQLSCGDLGRPFQRYPALAQSTGSLVSSCKSACHMFGGAVETAAATWQNLAKSMALGAPVGVANEQAPPEQTIQQRAAPVTFRDFLPKQKFAEALAPCSKETLNDVYDPAGSRSKKMPFVSVVCAHNAECTDALEAIKSAAHTDHTLHINGELFSGAESEGHLQAFLARFFEASPHGILVMEQVESMSYGSFKVLNNIISEHGNLQQDGQTIRTTGGLCIHIVKRFGVDACMLGLEQEVKSTLQQVVASSEGLEPMQSNLARSLRRRIDFVVSAASKDLPE